MLAHSAFHIDLLLFCIQRSHCYFAQKLHQPQTGSWKGVCISSVTSGRPGATALADENLGKISRPVGMFSPEASGCEGTVENAIEWVI